MCILLWRFTKPASSRPMTTFFLSCPFVLTDSVSRPRSSFFHRSKHHDYLSSLPYRKIFFSQPFFPSLLLVFIGLLCELLLRAWWALAFWDRRLGFFMLHGQRTLLPVARDHCTPWAPFFLFLVLSFTFSNFVRFFLRSTRSLLLWLWVARRKNQR